MAEGNSFRTDQTSNKDKGDEGPEQTSRNQNPAAVVPQEEDNIQDGHVAHAAPAAQPEEQLHPLLLVTLHDEHGSTLVSVERPDLIQTQETNEQADYYQNQQVLSTSSRVGQRSRSPKKKKKEIRKRKAAVASTERSQRESTSKKLSFSSKVGGGQTQSPKKIAERQQAAPSTSTSQNQIPASRPTRTNEDDLTKLEKQIVRDIHTHIGAESAQRKPQQNEQQPRARGPDNANPTKLSRAVEAEKKHTLRVSRSTTRTPMPLSKLSLGESLAAAPTLPSTTRSLNYIKKVPQKASPSPTRTPMSLSKLSLGESLAAAPTLPSTTCGLNYIEKVPQKASPSPTRTPMPFCNDPSLGAGLAAAPTPPSTTDGLRCIVADEEVPQEAQNASTAPKKQLVVVMPKFSDDVPTEASSSSSQELD